MGCCMNANDALDKMEAKVDELPLLPMVLVKIIQLDPNSEDYYDEFVRLLEEDPPFAVRVVALANSAAYHPVSPIVKIKDAVTRLGSDTVRSLVASLAVQRVFVPTSKNETKLWTHSISTAVTSKHLAKMIPKLEVNPEKAYLCGLLHDIGRFVMFEHAPQHLKDVDETHWQTPEELLEADVEVFKYAHTELGYRACKNWGLPEEVAVVVRDHHNHTLDKPTKPASYEATVACIRLADHLTVAVLENRGTESDFQRVIKEHVLVSSEEKNWLDAASLVSRLDAIRSEVDGLQKGMGFT